VSETSATRPPAHNDAQLSILPGPLATAVLGRVVGMLAARADCPIDRLDDALLLTDAIAAHAASHSIDGRVRVGIVAHPGELVLTVAALKPGGAQELLSAAELPGVGSLLEHVSDEVRHGAAGDGSGDELILRLGFTPGTRATAPAAGSSP
jgi:hypothetical protein